MWNLRLPQLYQLYQCNFTSVNPGVVPPLDTTLKAIYSTLPSDCPNYRFKEWTRHDQGGLEFTLPTVIPPMPPSMVFGKLVPEKENTEMIRCIIANHLEEKYGIMSPPGDVYQHTNAWWLLVTSMDETSPVSTSMPLICLGNLRH